MIILDIETSGLSPVKNAILEIAALKFEDPNIFLQTYCRIDEDDEIDPVALKVNGQSEEEIRDFTRPSQKEALMKLFEWIKKQNDYCIVGQNIGEFDWNFIRTKAEKYGLNMEIHRRSIDLHSLAFLRHSQVYGKLPIKNGISFLNLREILNFVGIKDERRHVSGGEIIAEGKFHGALEDCRLEAEAFSRLLYGKSLFKEYFQFPVPDYLKK